MNAGSHAVSCGVRVLRLHSRRGDLFTGGRFARVLRWKHSPCCESTDCDRHVAVASLFGVAISSVV
jgi:hypothetical protein